MEVQSIYYNLLLSFCVAEGYIAVLNVSILHLQWFCVSSVSNVWRSIHNFDKALEGGDTLGKLLCEVDKPVNRRKHHRNIEDEGGKVSCVHSSLHDQDNSSSYGYEVVELPHELHTCMVLGHGGIHLLPGILKLFIGG